MKTLYIDTHSTAIVIAIFKDEKLIQKKEIQDQKEHSTTCMPLIISLLEENELKIKDINEIIVVIGPGSFTGIRIGVTIAKTIAYTLNIPIKTMTSLEIHLPQEKKYKYIAIKEKNGYYLAEVNDAGNKIIKNIYITKDEYTKLCEKENILEKEKINYEEMIKYARQKDAVNPHKVNPFYVKKIEVEK